MPAKIIALSGGIGSGKDTAGLYLIEKHGYQKMSFSAALKDITARMFGWDREMLEGVTPEARLKREEVDTWWTDVFADTRDEDVTPRNMLQYLATEVLRDGLHPDIWALIVKRQLLTAPADAKIVITDARFFNEMRAIQDVGGSSYGIYRKLPTWLDAFYRYVDYNLNKELELGLMDVTLSMVYHRTGKPIEELVRTHAKAFFKESAKLNVHQSEWELYLYNNYDGTLDNSGTLDNLYAQLDMIA